MTELQTFIQAALQYRAVQGAVTGMATAGLVDFAAFRSWKSFDDARQYDWGIALWRWFQGAVVGALTGFGFGLTT